MLAEQPKKKKASKRERRNAKKSQGQPAVVADPRDLKYAAMSPSEKLAYTEQRKKNWRGEVKVLGDRTAFFRGDKEVFSLLK